MRLSILLGSILISLGCFGKTKKFLDYRGEYIWGVEVNTFKPCNSKKVYWVLADKKVISKLSKEHQKLTSKPYQPVLILLKGTINNSTDGLDGFAENYDGSIAVSSVKSIKKFSKNSCKN